MRRLVLLLLSGILYGWNVGDTLTVPIYRYGITVTQEPVNFVCVDSTEDYHVFYPFQITPAIDIVHPIGTRIYTAIEGLGVYHSYYYETGLWYRSGEPLTTDIFRIYFVKDTPITQSRWYFLSKGKFIIARSHSPIHFRNIYIPGATPTDTVISMGFSPLYRDSVILIATRNQVYRGYATEDTISNFYTWEIQPVGPGLARINDVSQIIDSSIFIVATEDGIFRWNGTEYQTMVPGVNAFRIKPYPYGYTGGYLVSTDQGLFMSDIFGENWIQFPQFNTPVNAFTTREDTIYLAFNNVGVVRFNGNEIIDTLSQGLTNPAMTAIGSMDFYSMYADNDVVLLGTRIGVFRLEGNTWHYISSNSPELGLGNNFSWVLLDSAKTLLEDIYPEVSTKVSNVLTDSLGVTPTWQDNLNIFFYPVFEYYDFQADIVREEIPVYGYPMNTGEPAFLINMSDFEYLGPRWLGLEDSVRRHLLSYLLARVTLDSVIASDQPVDFYEGISSLLTYWAYPDYLGTPGYWDVEFAVSALFSGYSPEDDPLSRVKDRVRAFLLNEYLYERLGRQAIGEIISSPDTGVTAYLNVLTSHGLDPGDFFSAWAIASRFDYINLNVPFRYENLELQKLQPERQFLSQGTPIRWYLRPFSSVGLYFPYVAGDLIVYAYLETPIDAKAYWVARSVNPPYSGIITELQFDSTGLAMDTIEGVGNVVDSINLIIVSADTIPSDLYIGAMTNIIPRPRNLRVESGHRSRVPLIWDKPREYYRVLSFYTYTVYRSTSQTGVYYPIASGIETEYYEDTLVTNGVTYYYYVTARALGVESVPSDTVSATPEEFPRPRNLRANFYGWVYLYWDTPYDGLQESYTLYRSALDSNQFVPIVTTTENYYVDTVYSTNWEYYVVANYVNPTGQSEPSDTVQPTYHSGTPGEDQLINLSVGQVWTWVTNNGDPVGGDFNNGWYGFDWPGGQGHNYYVWGSFFAVGARVNEEIYVTFSHYPPDMGEWYPGEVRTPHDQFSDLDVEVAMYDYADMNERNAWGRRLGVKVIERVLNWGNYHPFLNKAKAFIFAITYNREQCDIYGAGDTLRDVYVGLWVDADVSGSDQTDPHIDDMVDYDGWDGDATNTDMIDEITLLPDGTYLEQPDGVPDEYLVFGDEPDEVTLNGDTLIVSRNTSYMYDGDDPVFPVPDIGENGYSTGYIGGTLIYAPPSPSDSVWVENGDTLRMVLPAAHQWWDWENDPASDEDLYNYLSGAGQRILPPPQHVFDYRFLLTAGPFDIPDGDTIYVVYGVAVGEGLNGGDQNTYFPGQWIPGLRHVIDALWKEYYRGSQNSDPFHPSGPFEDVHWGGAVGVKEEESSQIRVFRLLSPFPNPSIGKATIRFMVGDSKTPISLKVYDVTGRLVETLLDRAQLTPGVHTIELRSKAKGGELSSGVYFIRLSAGKYTSVRKLVLIR